MNKFLKFILLFNLLLTSSDAGTESLLSDYEFRGIFEVNNTCTYSLFHKPTGKSAWGAIGQTILGIQIVNYESEGKTLTIIQNEQTEILELKKADEAPLMINLSSVSQSKAKLHSTHSESDPNFNPRVKRNKLTQTGNAVQHIQAQTTVNANYAGGWGINSADNDGNRLPTPEDLSLLTNQNSNTPSRDRNPRITTDKVVK